MHCGCLKKCMSSGFSIRVGFFFFNLTVKTKANGKVKMKQKCIVVGSRRNNSGHVRKPFWILLIMLGD